MIHFADTSLQALLNQLIHTASSREINLAFITAGGGAGLYDLFKIPGCSCVMLEARMLYSESSFHQFLETHLPQKFVSQTMADQLAQKLYTQSAANLCFALTCALKTNRERHGEDGGYVSLCRNGEITHRQKIDIPDISRTAQDAHVSAATIQIILNHLN